MTPCRAAIVAIASAFSLLAGCAGMEPAYEVRNTGIAVGDYDQVWSQLIRYFASHGITVLTVEKDSGVVYAETADHAGPAYADCGASLRPDLAQAGRLNVFVTSLDDVQQEVTVTSRFTALRRGFNGRYPVECRSTGALETEILQSVAAY